MLSKPYRGCQALSSPNVDVPGSAHQLFFLYVLLSLEITRKGTLPLLHRINLVEHKLPANRQ